MNSKQIYQIAHQINSFTLHLNNQNEEITDTFKGFYLKQIYRITINSKAKEYLVKFNHDHHSYYLYINIGSSAVFYTEETEQIKKWCEEGLTGRNRDGFSNAIIKYTDNKKLIAVLPCPCGDKAMTLCFSNGVTWRIDFFGTGQSELRIPTDSTEKGQKIIYWNPVASTPKIDNESRNTSLNDLLLLQTYVNLKTPEITKSKATAKKAKKEKKTKEEYLAMQKQSHMDKAQKLIDSAEKKILEETEIDWKSVTNAFADAKHATMKANRVDEASLKSSSVKTKKLELSLLKKSYDCYHKAYTANGFLVLGSKNANQVSQLLNAYSTSSNLYFHIDEHGGSSVLLIRNQEKEFEPIDIENAADCAVCWSRQTTFNEFPVYYVPCEQISLSAPSGLYLNQGSVFVTGKKNYLSSRCPRSGFSLLRRSDNHVEISDGPLHLQDKTIYCLNTTILAKPKKKITNDLKALLTTASYNAIVKEL